MMQDEEQGREELPLGLLSSPEALYDRTRQMMWSAVRYKEMRMEYSCALKEIRTKFDVLSTEFNIRNKRNPIASVSTRLKSTESTARKLLARHLPISLESIEKNIYDIAGIRVICSYIDDIYEIRSRVEGLAARRAAERAGEEELEQLKHLLDMQEFFTLKEDGTGIIDTDNHFHEMLYRMSGSLVLHDTLLPLHRKIVKYRQVSVGNSIRAKESFEEHRAIYEAVAAHDPDRAEELLLRHIENARASIMSQEEN